MAERLPSVLPRIAALVLVALAATAGMTYAAGSQLGSAPAVPNSTAPTPPLLVPDVRNQAFVFAKGTLEDAGFAWHVDGSVHGYAPNVVVSQSPAAGTHVVDSGAPLITLTLRRNSSYPQAGEATDTSPYQATAPEPADLAGRPIGPAAPAPATAAPAVAKPLTAAKPATAAPKPAAATSPAAVTAAKWPQSRPVAFVMPGARKEPLDEMPLPDRAKALATWLDAHPTRTPAAATYWLYQNAWIVTGAKFGWWRGADALKTLVAVDQRAQSLWGIGAKSAAIAAQALSDVQARAK